MTTPDNPVDAEIAAVDAESRPDPKYGAVTLGDQSFNIRKQPHAMHIVRAARADRKEDAEESLIVMMDILDWCLDDYQSFEDAFSAIDFDDIESGIKRLSEVVTEVMERTIHRPKA